MADQKVVDKKHHTTTPARTQVAGVGRRTEPDGPVDVDAGSPSSPDEGRDMGMTIGGSHNRRDADSAERAKFDRMERDPKATGDPGSIPGAVAAESDAVTEARRGGTPVQKNPPKIDHDLLGQTIHLREPKFDDEGNAVTKGKESERYADGSRCEAAIVHSVSAGGLDVEVLGRDGQDRLKTVSPEPGKGWHLASADR